MFYEATKSTISHIPFNSNPSPDLKAWIYLFHPQNISNRRPPFTARTAASLIHLCSLPWWHCVHPHWASGPMSALRSHVRPPPYSLLSAQQPAPSVIHPKTVHRTGAVSELRLGHETHLPKPRSDAASPCCGGRAAMVAFTWGDCLAWLPWTVRVRGPLPALAQWPLGLGRRSTVLLFLRHKRHSPSEGFCSDSHPCLGILPSSQRQPSAHCHRVFPRTPPSPRRLPRPPRLKRRVHVSELPRHFLPLHNI